MDSRTAPDWTQATPDEIEESIALTRASLDRHLHQLKGKFSPQARFRRIAIPLGIAAAGIVAGGIVWFLTRKRRHPVQAKVSRLKVRSAGIRDQVHAMRLLMTMVRKGKPGVFIIEPR
jgi:hypothetical protein